MKKLLYAGYALAASVSLASASQAADVVPDAYDWTGFYIGANAGVAWNNSSVENEFFTDGVSFLQNDIDGDQAAFTAGGLLGYNWQIDKLVLGLETDFNYLGFSDDNDGSVTFEHPGGPLTLTGKSSFEADWFGTIRGRLGFAVDNVLIYGTGGAAYGNVNADGEVTLKGDGGTKLASWDGSTDETNWGWTVGGGIEYGIDRWSLGLEYLYVDLGESDWNDKSSTKSHNYELDGSADWAFSTVRASVKYRF